MPKNTILDAPSVRPAPAPQNLLDPAEVVDRSGSIIGAALNRVAAQALQAQEREVAKAKEFAAADLDMKFSREVGTLLYDQQSGFMLQRDANALDSGPVLDKIVKLREKYAAMAADPDVRADFEQRIGSRAETWMREIDRHAGEQRRSFYKGVSSGQAGLAKEQARLAYRDPDGVDKAVKSAARTLITNWAENDGLAQEEVMRLWKVFESETWAEAAEQYVGKNDGVGGLKFLNAPGVREKLGRFAPVFEAKVRPIADANQAEVLAEELFQGSFGVDQGMDVVGMSPEGKEILKARPSQEYAKAMLRQMKAELDTPEAKAAGRDPMRVEVFSKVDALIDSKFAAWRAGFTGDADLKYKAAVQIWERAGHDLSAIPENLKLDLQGTDDWHQLEAKHEAWRQAKLGSPASPEQRRALVQWYLDLANKPHLYDNWDSARFDREVGSRLHPNDVEQAGLRLAAVQGRPDRLTAGLEPMMQLYNRLGGGKAFPNLADPENRDMTKWNQDQVDIYYAGAQQVQEWLANWHKSDHKEATPPLKEYQGAIESIFAKGYTPGRWFGVNATTRLQAQVTGKPFEANVKKIDEIPYGTREDIRKRLFDKEKKWPTDADVIRLYNEMVRIVPPPKSKTQAPVVKAGVGARSTNVRAD